MDRIEETPVKRILIIGEMQSGKTTYAVNKYLGVQTPAEIEVFINYNTNASMESTNKKIRQFKNTQLISGLTPMRNFHRRLSRGRLDNTKKYVISLIAHHSHAEELKTIITAYSRHYGEIIKTFNINIDEDDAIALDHTVKKGLVQKQRIIQAIIELSGIRQVRHITATPFTNNFAHTDFDEVITAPAGESYCGIETIVDNAKQRFDDKDIKSLYSTKPSLPIIEYLQEGYEGVDLIQIVKNKKDHSLIVANIIKYNNNCVIGVSNSDKASSNYFIKGKAVGKKTDGFAPEEAYRLAKEHGITRVFIVAYFLTDRTNTFRSRDGMFNRMRSLFHCTASANTETILQRVGRLCGYPVGHIPELLCSETTFNELDRALGDYELLLDIPNETMKLAADREKVNKSSGYQSLKNKHTNGFKNKTIGTYYSSEKPVGQLLSNIYYDCTIPKDIDTTNKDFRENFLLKNYILKKYEANTILNCTTETKKRLHLLRPNQESSQQGHRELGIIFNEDESFTVIKQDFDVYPTGKEFSIHEPDGSYSAWSISNGVVR
jgi:hypothetical protein